MRVELESWADGSAIKQPGWTASARKRRSPNEQSPYLARSPVIGGLEEMACISWPLDLTWAGTPLALAHADKTTIAGGVKMDKPRLVKRKEVIEPESDDQLQTPPPPAVPKTVSAVVDWMQGRQPDRRMNPREAFAALFAQPQAN